MIWRGVRVRPDGTINAWLTLARETVSAAEVGADCRGVADQATWDLLLALRGAGAALRVHLATGRIIATVDRSLLARPEVRRAMGDALSAALSAAVLQAAAAAPGTAEILAGHVDGGTVGPPAPADGGPWEDAWLTADEMAAHCPPCAERMRFSGLRRVRASRNARTGAVRGYEQGVRDALAFSQD